MLSTALNYLWVQQLQCEFTRASTTISLLDDARLVSVDSRVGLVIFACAERRPVRRRGSAAIQQRAQGRTVEYPYTDRLPRVRNVVHDVEVVVVWVIMGAEQ